MRARLVLHDGAANILTMAWVYILLCGDGSFYVGSTRNLDLRMHQHATGKGSAYTAKRMPVELVWAHEFDNVAEAYAMEKKVQGWSKAKRRALVEGRFDDLPALSRKRFR